MGKKALGRGLSALIPSEVAREAAEVGVGGGGRGAAGVGLEELLVEAIAPNPRQPRERFDEASLGELAASVKASGVIQPLLVRRKGDGYELIAGERRLRAARLAGMTRVPAVVKRVGERESLELSLVENMQRESLNPLEEAHALAELASRWSLTQEELAAAVGKDRSAIANTLRLLRLPEEAQRALLGGLITRGHALALLALPAASQQVALLARVVREGLSVRETEEISSRTRPKRARRRGERAAILVDLEERLCRRLGTQVRLVGNERKGKVEIRYWSPEDLQGLLEGLGITL